MSILDNYTWEWEGRRHSTGWVGAVQGQERQLGIGQGPGGA